MSEIHARLAKALLDVVSGPCECDFHKYSETPRQVHAGNMAAKHYKPNNYDLHPNPDPEGDAALVAESRAGRREAGLQTRTGHDAGRKYPADYSVAQAVAKKDSKYEENGHFKGKAGSGDRFKNCMRSGKSRALCAAIGRAAGKIP